VGKEKTVKVTSVPRALLNIAMAGGRCNFVNRHFPHGIIT
jgi:hypothetical protein